MNTKQIQFNRQQVAALVLAGVIMVLTAGLAWTGADASSSTTQPVQKVQDCAYSAQPGQGGPAVGQVDCLGVDFLESESRLLPSSRLRFVKGKAAGASGTNF